MTDDIVTVLYPPAEPIELKPWEWAKAVSNLYDVFGRWPSEN